MDPVKQWEDICGLADTIADGEELSRNEWMTASASLAARVQELRDWLSEADTAQAAKLVMGMIDGH